MSTIKSLALVLVLAASSFVTACTSSDAAPAPQGPVAKPATASTDLQSLCVQMMTRNRECTEQFIPALVDARAKYDRPAGIAEAVKQDRAGVIAQAMEEWKTDSTDESIAATCTKITAEQAPQADQDQVQSCLAKTDCSEYVSCVMPLTEKRFAN